MEKKVVIVLGMHRSGTSMIGGVLSCLGVDMGEDAPGRQVSNPLGHFEDRDFLELNQEILAAAGGSWDDPPDPSRLQDLAGPFSERIARTVAHRAQSPALGMWGWKDPRTSLTIGLFRPYLDRPYLVWCQRDPEQVADSLLRRNQFDRTRSRALIRVYQDRIREFINANPDLPVLEIPYQEVVQQPSDWVDRIVNFLGIDPSERELSEAVSMVMPKHKIAQERTKVRFLNLICLPYRALKKVMGLLGGD